MGRRAVLTSEPLDPVPAVPPPGAVAGRRQERQLDWLRVIAALLLPAAAAVCARFARQAMTGG
jgi:hypothetical protein